MVPIKSFTALLGLAMFTAAVPVLDSSTADNNNLEPRQAGAYCHLGWPNIQCSAGFHCKEDFYIGPPKAGGNSGKCVAN
jgi:hypothetical protein